MRKPVPIRAKRRGLQPYRSALKESLMNIAFFLTPKSELVVLEENMTVRQAMEKMEYHRFTAMPLINSRGKYVGSLSEGDMLWYLKNKDGILLQDTEKELVGSVKRYRHIYPVEISSDMEALYELAAVQSFVPIVDDQNIFIGIIKRGEILKYFLQKTQKLEAQLNKDKIRYSKVVPSISFNH